MADKAVTHRVDYNYSYTEGNRPTALLTQHTQAIAVSSPNKSYTQAELGGFYPSRSISSQLPVTQDAPGFNVQPSLIPLPFRQPHLSTSQSDSIPESLIQQDQLQQYGTLSHPTNSSFFNINLSSLNFGKCSGTLGFGMFDHISSDTTGSLHDIGKKDTFDCPAAMCNQSLPFNHQDRNHAMATKFGPSDLPLGEWHELHSRQGSMRMQTPAEYFFSSEYEHSNHGSDSIDGPHASTIGQTPSTNHFAAIPAPADVSAFGSYQSQGTAALSMYHQQPYIQGLHLANRPQ